MLRDYARETGTTLEVFGLYIAGSLTYCLVLANLLDILGTLGEDPPLYTKGVFASKSIRH